MNKELTPRQIKEQKAYEAEKTKPQESVSRVGMTPTDTRNFYRKQAGWPPMKVK
jgi:topoisomerase IA-like protein